MVERFIVKQLGMIVADVGRSATHPPAPDHLLLPPVIEGIAPWTINGDFCDVVKIHNDVLKLSTVAPINRCKALLNRATGTNRNVNATDSRQGSAITPADFPRSTGENDGSWCSCLHAGAQNLLSAFTRNAVPNVRALAGDMGP